MLQQLDTVIGFSVVMAVISLLIMIATQMISTILGLRGLNLADSLEVMILKIDPDNEANFKGASKMLANKILTDPAISDSILPMSSIGFQWWKRATAIRPDEFLAILQEIAGISASTAQTIKADIDSFSTALSSNATQEKINSILLGLASAAKEAATATPANADLAQWSLVLAQMAQEAGAIGQDAKRWSQFLQDLRIKAAAMGMLSAIRSLSLLKNSLRAADEAVVTDLAAMQKWFNSIQDRAQQWFGTHTRIVTSVLAFVAAFALQLDTIQLLQHISADPDIRAKLVAEADTLQKTEETAVADSAAVSPALDKEILAVLYKEHPQIAGQLDNRADALNLEQTDAWIRQQLKALNGSDAERIVQAYNRLFAMKKLGLYTQSSENLITQLDQTGLQLLPQPYPSIFAESWDPSKFWMIFSGTWSWPPAHLVGILISAALLTLGAPFWFNTLKTLTNLRPSLANQIDNQPTQKTSPKTGENPQ